MIAFRHVMCPIDFSDTAARALTYATALATWYEAQLTVLHVATTFDEAFAPVGDAGGEPYPGSRDDIIARIRRSMEQAGASALKARPLAQEGHASELIVNCAAAQKADLLVMGTHGLGGFHRLLLGSVTEKVVRTATCPVLTVPPSAPATTAARLVARTGLALPAWLGSTTTGRRDARVAPARQQRRGCCACRSRRCGCPLAEDCDGVAAGQNVFRAVQ